MTNDLVAAARDLRREISERADKAGDDPIPQATIDSMVEAGLYGVLIPNEVGGNELPLDQAIDVFAEVARADGSAGWCLMAGSMTAGYFGAYCPPELTDRMFGDGIPMAAGQFAPNGQAQPTDVGYRLNGKFNFGSGISHASWVGGGFFTTPPEGENPDYIFTIMPIEDVTVAGNWHVMGLKSTASYDYSIDNVEIDKSQSFNFFDFTRYNGSATFDLGVLPLTSLGHAAWAIGVTRRALDELAGLAKTKQRMGAPTVLAENERFLHDYGLLEARLRSAEMWVKDIYVQAEQTVHNTGVADPLDIGRTRMASHYINHQGSDIIREAYLLAGTTALRDGALQRCMRDIHAGTQHAMASSTIAVEYGRDLLGLAPEDPLEA
jgi:alkylation response protein AidB-like acyl-CoA dehydrogenase